jgi:predicted  nucleic acid-binding Zn-ribbon protein
MEPTKDAAENEIAMWKRTEEDAHTKASEAINLTHEATKKLQTVEKELATAEKKFAEIQAKIREILKLASQ